MATDGPTPAPCAPDIYKNGTLVLMTHTIPSCAMERWVKAVAEESGQPVDWHFAGGRACVLALGDLAKVRAAILNLMPEHDRLQTKAATTEAFGEIWSFRPSCTLYGQDEMNPAHEFARQTVLERGVL